MNEKTYEIIHDFNFTENARTILSSTINHPDFYRFDSDMIFYELANRLSFIEFGYYLKRYIYKKEKMTEPVESIDDTVYISIIKEKFKETETPTSLDRVVESIDQFAERMLTEKITRKDVLILGFGLKMSSDSINTFLTKYLQERGLNSKNPTEAICSYCYRKQYNYKKYKELRKAYDAAPYAEKFIYVGEKTPGVQGVLQRIENDDELIAFVSTLKTKDSRAAQFSVSARENFQMLYNKAAKLILADKQRLADEKYENELQQLREKMTDNNRYFTAEASRKIREFQEKRRVFTIDNVSVGDFIKVMYSSIPKDKNQNLPVTTKASLGVEFARKGIRKKSLHDILNNNKEITRYDLINLQFLIYAKTFDARQSRNQRMKDFYESTNTILRNCSMGSLYAANPYECFIMMCIVSPVPLVTYADVWALTYNVSEDKLNSLYKE